MRGKLFFVPLMFGVALAIPNSGECAGDSRREYFLNYLSGLRTELQRQYEIVIEDGDQRAWKMARPEAEWHWNTAAKLRESFTHIDEILAEEKSRISGSAENAESLSDSDRKVIERSAMRILSNRSGLDRLSRNDSALSDWAYTMTFGATPLTWFDFSDPRSARYAVLLNTKFNLLYLNDQARRTGRFGDTPLTPLQLQAFQELLPEKLAEIEEGIEGLESFSEEASAFAIQELKVIAALGGHVASIASPHIAKAALVPLANIVGAAFGIRYTAARIALFFTEKCGNGFWGRVKAHWVPKEIDELINLMSARKLDPYGLSSGRVAADKVSAWSDEIRRTLSGSVPSPANVRLQPAGMPSFMSSGLPDAPSSGLPMRLPNGRPQLSQAAEDVKAIWYRINNALRAYNERVRLNPANEDRWLHQKLLDQRNRFLKSYREAVSTEEMLANSTNGNRALLFFEPGEKIAPDILEAMARLPDIKNELALVPKAIEPGMKIPYITDDAVQWVPVTSVEGDEVMLGSVRMDKSRAIGAVKLYRDIARKGLSRYQVDAKFLEEFLSWEEYAALRCRQYLSTTFKGIGIGDRALVIENGTLHSGAVVDATANTLQIIRYDNGVPIAISRQAAEELKKEWLRDFFLASDFFTRTPVKGVGTRPIANVPYVFEGIKVTIPPGGLERVVNLADWIFAQRHGFQLPAR